MSTTVRILLFAAGMFFLALGAASLATPLRARRFLLGFASSPYKHYAELAVRCMVGCAFILSAHDLLFPSAFSLFGWILLATTAGLLLVPWRWHHRFAQRTVPQALRFLPVLAVCCIALGVLVLVAVVRGSAA
jgi:hypothetical protein